MRNASDKPSINAIQGEGGQQGVGSTNSFVRGPDHWTVHYPT